MGKRRRPKLLCLGVSYTCVKGQPLFVPASSLSDESASTESSSTSSSATHNGGEVSVQTVIDSVRAGTLTAMDGRDLARCLATEKVCGVDVYTVSQEQAAVYRSDRHLHSNFAHRNFVDRFIEHFDEDNPPQFDQVILDYFWIPRGWDATHWTKAFFTHTLINLVERNLLVKPAQLPTRTSTRFAAHRRPSTAKNSKAGSGVYLPFCLHCFKNVLANRKRLLRYYNISFLRKNDLSQVNLWRGTQSIDEILMQRVLGKRRDQEEVYCTFGPREVGEGLDDPMIPKGDILDYCRRLEDFADIRFIVLEPIPPQNDGEESCQPRGQFFGLQDPSKVKRGFDKVQPACPPTPMSLKRPCSAAAVSINKRRKEQGKKAVAMARRTGAKNVKRTLKFEGEKQPATRRHGYALRARWNAPGESPKSVVCEPASLVSNVEYPPQLALPPHAIDFHKAVS